MGCYHCYLLGKHMDFLLVFWNMTHINLVVMGHLSEIVVPKFNKILGFPDGFCEHIMRSLVEVFDHYRGVEYDI